jgi:hypothetical protein
LSAPNQADKVTYSPFILTERSLLLVDQHMESKCHVFQERKGWIGSGYDWNSIAQVIVSERLPGLANELSFDSEGGMFVAVGPHAALEQLGKAMHLAYHDDNALRDLLSRAELD